MGTFQTSAMPGGKRETDHCAGGMGLKCHSAFKPVTRKTSAFLEKQKITSEFQSKWPEHSHIELARHSRPVRRDALCLPAGTGSWAAGWFQLSGGQQPATGVL